MYSSRRNGIQRTNSQGDRYKASADGETQTVGTDPKFKEAQRSSRFANMLKDLTKQSPKAKKLAEEGFAFWSATQQWRHENSGLQSLEGAN